MRTDGSSGPAASSGPPDVTVVTVTYQAAHLVLECLASLQAQRLAGLTMEVVVVDNASSDGTADLVAERFPEVRLIRSPVNTGFAGGNNLALATVRSPWVVLLNNDAVAEPTAIRSLVHHFQAAPPDVAAVTARVLLWDRFRPARPSDPPTGRVHGPDGEYVPDPDGPVRLVNSTGNQVRQDGYGVDRGWLSDAARHRAPRDVFGFCGAAAALRTSALSRVGLFDEDFFLYYEDSDLSWRLRLAGYRVEHCADALVHHRHAASTGEGSEVFRFYDGRNRLLMVIKDASALLAVRTVVRAVVTALSITLRRSQELPLVRTRWRALASVARLLPRMLARRRTIGRSAVVPRTVVEQLLTPVPPVPVRGYHIG